MNVDGDATPRFTFTGQKVNRVLVYRVPSEYLKEGIPLDVLTKDNPDTQWLVEGPHDAGVPITYGVAPSEMKQTLAAKPLVEGQTYLVSIYITTQDTGAFVGQYFRIQKGQTLEFHGEGDDSKE